MRGTSFTHVGGGDRTVPLHVPYSEPKAKPTGLDWSSLTPEATTPAEVAEAKPTCNHCREHVDTVSVHTGLCPGCEHELDPHHQSTPQESTMATTQSIEIGGREVAPYILQLVELLAATEGHPDPLVRATRKTVTQSAIALQQAAAAAPQTSGSAATATAHSPSLDAGSISPAGPEAPRTNGTGAKNAAARIVALGTTSADIRSWATQNGIACTPKGIIPSRVVDAYAAAHTHQEGIPA